jgi:carbon-monoxide dehydrogenase iron sulfur subunit
MDCPEDALSLRKQGQVVVSPTLCTSCGICEKACPIGAIEIFNKIVYICDLCGGKPKCVEACTEGAITFEPDNTEQISLEEIKKDTVKMNPSQKRHFYIKKIGSSAKKKRERAHV